MNNGKKNDKRAPYRNNRRKNSNCRGKDETRTSRKEETTTTNDPAWYTRFPQLTKDAASLWFSNPLGAVIPRLTSSSIAGGRDVDAALGAVPGLMVLNTILGPGTSADANSPLNATSRDIYSFIRHANSGHSNYSAPDLTMYLLCLDAYYTVWAKMVRAYGVASLVTKTSRYTAVRILQALGFDADNILSNMANFRYAINNFAVKLSSYATPGSMDIYRRHTEIYTNIYQDSMSTKAQLYLLDPAGYYVYGEESAQGGKLTYTEYPGHLMTVNDVIAVFNTFNTVINSEDMNIISGDILKAYGREGIFNVPAIDSGYITPVVVDPHMLAQIENATIVGTMNADSLNISQNPATNQVIYLPSVMGKVDSYPALVLNFHKPDPDVNDIMEATRFMVTFGDYDDISKSTPIMACGADIVVGVGIYTFIKNGNFERRILSPYIDVNVGADLIAQLLVPVFLANSFAYAPRCAIWWGTYLIADTMDYDEYTTISPEVLWNIHNTALLSLLDVPRIGLQK